MISRSSNVIASTLLSLGPKRVQKAADVCSSPQKNKIFLQTRFAKKQFQLNYYSHDVETITKLLT